MTPVGDLSKVKLSTYNRDYLPPPPKGEKILSEEEQKALVAASTAVNTEGFIRYEKKTPGNDHHIATMEINAPEEGNYSVWLLVRGKPKSGEWATLNVTLKEQVLSQVFESEEWQWVKMESKKVKLPKGEKAPKGGLPREPIIFSKGANVVQIALSNIEDHETGLMVDLAAVMISNNAKFIPKEIKMYDGNGAASARCVQKIASNKTQPLSSWQTGALSESRTEAPVPSDKD